ncbi:MAG: large conductance mechanosensitive channel protein [Candidatus Saccharibacteria bacterium]|nr:large conductance mechanosensitive channel protein [Candidatus Saccharibacteria bacterium]
MLQEFKKFILRGNVVDLAVAVVIGAAFTSVVTAFVKDFLTPLIAAVQGDREFSKYAFELNGVAFPYGDFLNTLITFLLTAAVVFFLVVQPLNRLMELARKKKPTPDPTTHKCPECLGEIPIAATRCMYCTTKVQPTAKKAS